MYSSREFTYFIIHLRDSGTHTVLPRFSKSIQFEIDMQTVHMSIKFGLLKLRYYVYFSYFELRLYFA